MQLDRFTQKAQEAIVAAQATAQRLDSPILDAEHILSALIEPDHLRNIRQAADGGTKEGRGRCGGRRWDVCCWGDVSVD